jgi:hypothetical protein
MSDDTDVTTRPNDLDHRSGNPIDETAEAPSLDTLDAGDDDTRPG